ncbi:uncharacterized protein LOC125673711 [Ostrea edulis]|uniref:uncharacterized protein LOC125673711 n=1 Tax=Ostrea edulis TaxID=37623 RepID=UPI0024AF06CD|nr:uncharacterized protein LOC125673711 [Ostrea edulis]
MLKKMATLPEDVSSPLVKLLLENARLTATIKTGYTPYSVSCLSDEEFWTIAEDEIIRLHNLQGQLLTSIQTESGHKAWDIAVTQEGNLVYTDPDKGTVNLVKNKQIQTLFTLQGWKPRYICITSTGDLLVTMRSKDYKQSKIMRYSDSKETQTIQFDDQGRPLYSCGTSPRFICENRNGDICVADNEAKAVVVVNQSGKLRFRYTGHPSNTKQSFDPVGITTDSQSHILTAEFTYHLIHMVDQDGQFLCYIEKCGLLRPWDLCVDTKDNLIVAELSCRVKKVTYQ